MGYTYSIDDDRRVIFVKCTGLVTVRDLCSHWIAFLEDPGTFAVRRTLVDLREADMSISFQEMHFLIESLVKPCIRRTTWSGALVVSDSAAQSMAQDFHLLAQSFSNDRVFTDADAALEWLSRQPVGDGGVSGGGNS